MSRQSQHQDDKQKFSDEHKPAKGTTEGIGCLVAHESGREKGAKGKLKRTSCNYRWQAFERALHEDRNVYNYPAYRALCEGDAFSMSLRRGEQKGTKPTEGSWNVSANGDNFQTSCNAPYWHEAHHLIPNGELKLAIETNVKGPFQAEFRDLYRKGLLGEKYNLNHKENMIILPLDAGVAVALKLPRHREDASVFHHKAYSNEVRTRLRTVFTKMTKTESDHEVMPNYKTVANRLVNVSRHMRRWVLKAGGARSLDGAVLARKKGKDE